MELSSDRGSCLKMDLNIVGEWGGGTCRCVRSLPQLKNGSAASQVVSRAATFLLLLRERFYGNADMIAIATSSQISNYGRGSRIALSHGRIMDFPRFTSALCISF